MGLPIPQTRSKPVVSGTVETVPYRGLNKFLIVTRYYVFGDFRRKKEGCSYQA